MEVIILEEGSNMKKIFNISILTIAVSFLFTGCYTIVWDPNMEFPNEETYNYNEDSEFYDYEDYGGYVDYYESPWWVTPVVYITTTNENGDNVVTKVRNEGRNSDTEDIRNSGGRGNNDRTNEITTPTVTQTTNSGSGNTNSSSSNNNSTTTSTRDSNSNNSSTTNSNTRSSGSSDTRNNSGSRNSGGRR